MNKKRFQKIYIEITNICNLKCSFCPEGRREKEFMSIEDFEYIINQIKDYTNLITLHVKGEPLVHPRLEKILYCCEQNEISVNITTNGTLLLEKGEILQKSKALRQLNISLHSLLKNQNIDFKKYMENVFNVVKKLDGTYISYRLWNLTDIRKNAENIELLKCLENEYNCTNLINKAKDNEFVELSKNIFLNQDVEFKWPDIKGKVISDTGTCWGLRNQIAILVGGEVVPCCLDQNGDINLGNIFLQSFEEIINSEYSKQLIKGFEENRIIHNLCKRCGFRGKFSNKKE